MKKIVAFILFALCLTAAFAGSFSPNQAYAPVVSAPSYNGFLDTYAGATWGVSAYKLTNAYGGNWGTVKRQSDNATQVIGWDANSKANISTFNTFCSGTNCYLTTWNDQVNSINATQATLANMPRVIVDENSLLAVCPQPGSSMATSFNSTVNTAKQHLFAVVNAHTADYKYNQPGLPTYIVTGNITNGSSGITAMSSQVGLSTANDLTSMGTSPGIKDSAGFIPFAPATATTGQTYITAYPTGTTGTMAFNPGNISPTGSQTGDTLTITNSVLGGVWIMNGPPNATFETSAYWGLGMATDHVQGDITGSRNTTSLLGQNFVGNGIRGQWGVYDFDTSTTQFNYDGVSFGTLTTTADITYSTNVGMTLFANAAGSQNLSNSCFETMVLFPSVQASRVAMAQALMSQDSIAFPFAPNTSDGFVMAGSYAPNNYKGTTNSYGAASSGPDALGQTWNFQSGGYTYPSIARATNVNNTATLWEFAVGQGDIDINITGQERSEINTVGTFAPGQSFSVYYTFQFKQYSTHLGSWCYGGQMHYNDDVVLSTGAPDLVTFSCLNSQIQFQRQCCQSGGVPVTTNCGSAFAFTVGTTYAVEIEGFWSTNHTSDTLAIHAGPIGSALPSICSASGALWDNDTGAYLKAGIYRGGPWENPGTVIMRQTNMQLSTTANAFSAYITTQPAQPTHPFLLKRDLDPAANDNTPMWLNAAA